MSRAISHDPLRRVRHPLRLRFRPQLLLPLLAPHRPRLRRVPLRRHRLRRLDRLVRQVVRFRRRPVARLVRRVARFRLPPVDPVRPARVRADSRAVPVRLVRELVVPEVRARVGSVDRVPVVAPVVRARVVLADRVLAVAPVAVLGVVPVADPVVVPVVDLVRPVDVVLREAGVVGVAAKRNCCRQRSVTPRPMHRCPRASSSSNEVYRPRSSRPD